MYETILKLNGKALQCNWPYSQVLGVSGYRKATSFTASVHHSAAVTFCFFWPRFSHVTHCAWQVRQNQWWHTTGACHVSTTGWFVINSSQPDSWGWCLWYIQNQTKTCRMFHGNVSHPWTDAKKTQPAKAARTTSSMVCSSHIHLGQTPVTIQQTPVLRMGRNGQFVKN